MKPETLSVLNPVVEIDIDGKKIQVRELSWPDALQFYAKLRDQAKNLLDANGNLVLDASKMLTAVSENIELANWLVLKSTRKDEAWLNERTISEVLDIITVALEINLSIIASKIKNARSRLGGMLGGATTQK